jgi:hypothetical protein
LPAKAAMAALHGHVFRAGRALVEQVEIDRRG